MLANRVRIGSGRKEDVYLARDSDFVNVNGYWVYRGTAKWVVIPTHINGELVTSTQYMFCGHSTYQATPVTKVVLDHSNVTNMSNMFNYSTVTALDLSSFDTSNVTDMASMFSDSQATTLDLSSFNTSNVTNMTRMFMFSSATTLDLSSFDTSNVTSMGYMFRYSKATTLDLSSFNTSATGVYGMFDGSKATTGYARTQADANKFNASADKPTGLNFVVKLVYLAQDSDFVKVNNSWVYRGASKWVEIPTHINGELVTSTQYMFCGTSTYKATPVTKVVLDHSNVTNMRSMFESSQATTLDLSSFDTSNVTTMQSMFESSQATTLDLSSFDTSNVTNMSYMFRNSSATTGYARKQTDANKFNASPGKPAGLNFVSPYLAQDSDFVKVDGCWVYRGSELEVEIPHIIQGESITSYQYMFSGYSTENASPVTKVVSDNPNITNLKGMFYDSKATTLDLSSFDTSNVTDMGAMFYGSKATTLDLSSFDTSNVTNMSSMFDNSKATTGYARTQADADKFNASAGKPAGLNFVVKP